MITDFFYENKIAILISGIVSLLTFVGTLAAIPIILIKIPADYFTRRIPLWRRSHPVIRPLVLILKNIFGILLFLAGLVMLFIPGQGILTMLIGISLINFPGKRKLEIRILSNHRILPVINSIRKRAGKIPLEFPREKKT